MRSTKHRITALAAAAVITAALPEPVRLHLPDDAETLSVLAFAEAYAARSDADDCFAMLRYDPAKQSLTCDGRQTGGACSGFAVRNGRLCMDADAVRTSAERFTAADTGAYVTLEEAEEKIGLETYTDEQTGEVVVTSPFQTGELIVKSGKDFDTHGGREIAGGYRDLHVLQFDTPADAYAAYTLLSDDPAVEYAEPNRMIAAASYEDGAGEDVEWGYSAVGADDFFAYPDENPITDQEIVVAVLDTGIYAEHEMFRGRIADGALSMHEEGEGSIADYSGHGTHCAGIVCSVTPPNVKILPVKCMDADGGSSLQIFCAMAYAAEHADVVSMSLAGLGWSPLLHEGVYILKEKDIPCIAAAGNESMNVMYSHPANCEPCFSISAVQLAYEASPVLNPYRYELSTFSNFGSGLDFAAPGTNILSAGLESPTEMVYKSGTSMATPYAAGVAASILCLNPDYTTEEIYSIMRDSAMDLGESGFDEKYGWGLVQLRNLRLPEQISGAPVVTVPSGSYPSPFRTEFINPTEDADLYYCIDGGEPVLYDGNPFPVNHSMKLRVYAEKDGKRSQVLHVEYEIFCEAPSILVTEASDGSYSEVSMECQETAAIYYTTDGSDPSPENGTLYQEPLKLTETTLVRAVTVVGDCCSPIAEQCAIVGGENMEKMFRVENGVLTAYYGRENYLDLTTVPFSEPVTAIGEQAFKRNFNLRGIILPDTVTSIGKEAFAMCVAMDSIQAKGVTELGEGAFDSCPNLYQVKLGALTKIGASAFAYCSGLSMIDTDLSALREIPDNAFRNCNCLNISMLQWDTLTSIGENAFSCANVPRELHLDALETLGDNAFSGSNTLARIYLPERVHVLPDGAFAEAAQLSYVSAPGVTEIGTDAFSFTMSFRDRAPIRLDLNWEGITKLHSRALNSVSLTEPVTFSALTELEAGSLSGLFAVSLSLPKVKTMPTGAMKNCSCQILYLEQVETLEADSVKSNYGMNVILGSSLKNADRNAMSATEPGMLHVYAPQDSPVRVCVDGTHVMFHTAADVVVTDRVQDVWQNTHVMLRAMPLGFDMQIRWFCADADGEQGKQFAEGLACNPDTSACGTRYYYAQAIREGKVCAVSEYVPVTVKEIPFKDTLLPADAPYILPLMSEPDFYLFTPDETGDYYIFSSEWNAEVTVQGADLELTQCDSLYTDRSEMKPVRLTAGESYTVMQQTSEKSYWHRLYIERELPPEPDPFTDMYIVLSQETYELTDAPVFPEFKIHAAINGFDDTELTEDLDYTVRYSGNDSSGSGYVQVFSLTNRFCNEKAEFMVVQKLQPEQEITVHDLIPDYTQFFTFTPPVTGSYSFYTDLPDALFADSSVSLNGNDIEFEYVMSMELIDANYMTVAENYGSLPALDSELILNEGQTYQLRLLPSVCEISEVKLGVTQTKKPLNNTTYITVEYPIQVTGFPFIPEFEVNTAERALTAGVDYETYLYNNDMPGQMTILVKGIGDFCGTNYTSNKSFNAIDIIPDAAVFQPVIYAELNEPFAVNSAYTFIPYIWVDSLSALTVETEDGSTDFSAVIYQTEDEGGVNMIGTFPTDEPVWVKAGSCSIVIKQQPGELHHYCIRTAESTVPLGLMDITVNPVLWNGKQVRPDVRVVYNGTVMEEGIDYELMYPPVLGIGEYYVTIEGIGKCVGQATFNFTVLPEQDAQETIRTGKTVVNVETGGQSAVYKWIPDKTRYCIRSNSVLNRRIRVYTRDMKLVTELSDLGELTKEINVRAGAEYYVCASLVSTRQTGSYTLELLDDYKLLKECSLAVDSFVVTQDGKLPPYAILDGYTVLQEGTDYIVNYNLGEGHGGRGEIGFTGIGKYVGTVSHPYTVCPPFIPEAAYEGTLLEINFLATDQVGMPGSSHWFRFTAPNDGDYYLDLPNSFDTGITSIVYDPEYSALLPGVSRIYLKQGEQILILCVAEMIANSENGSVRDEESWFNVGVSDFRDPYYWYDETSKLYYIIEYDEAILLGSNNCSPSAITVPVEVYVPEFNKLYPVTRMQEEYEVEKAVFYCERGSSFAEYCTEHGILIAYNDASQALAGDVSGDGFTDKNDALMLQYWLSEAEGVNLNETAFANADFNGDGNVDLNDVYAILKYHELNN